MNAKQYDLTAVNAAIEALSYVQPVPLPTDAAIFDVLNDLLEIRSRLTDKPWPERPLKSANLADFEYWHQCEAAKQRVEGLQ